MTHSPHPLDLSSTLCRNCDAVAFYRYSVHGLAQFWCPTCRRYTTLTKEERNADPNLITYHDTQPQPATKKET